MLQSQFQFEIWIRSPIDAQSSHRNQSQVRAWHQGFTAKNRKASNKRMHTADFWVDATVASTIMSQTSTVPGVRAPACAAAW